MSPGLLSAAKRLASTPHGRRGIRQAMDYAKSPKGQQQLASARERLAAARARRKPR